MAAVETFRGVAFPWLTDQMGHMTTSRYIEMFDVAAYHFFHMIGFRHDLDQYIGLADVRQEVDYKDEVAVGALVLIRSGLVSVGRSSLRVRHVMTDPDQTKVHAVMEAVTVRFDLQARRSMQLPDDFAGRIATFKIEDKG